MKENECLLTLSPLKKYSAPKYPAYINAQNNPDLLKKLPSRWLKNTKVLTCLGLMGAFTLTGCPPFDWGSPIWGGNSTCSNCGFPHMGGSGGAPIYIVYLTEQDALNVMREKGESKGLDFSATPPDYSVDIDWGGQNVNFGIDLFDENKNLGLSFVNLRESGWNWCYDSNQHMASQVKEGFAEIDMDNGIEVGVMHNPQRHIGLDEPNEAERKAAEEILREQLALQVRNFLLEQGIIQ
ncbi:MAG: hypothetical protein FWC97_11805 [Treponema sp.]|nr:hypothetical protein [Treponema sp.]